MTAPMPERIQEAIAIATKLVESWPEWKRNILADIAKPMLDKPRQHVDNFAGARD